MSAAANRLAISSRIASKTGFVELSNATHGSKFRCFGSAAAASDPLKEEKESKKISKPERRAILEAFVDQYRASNTGRFPTASYAKKQIGGSYYYIRQIIQELEFNHKMSLLGKNKDSQVEKTEQGNNLAMLSKEHPGPSEVEEVSKPVITASCVSSKDIDIGYEIRPEDIVSVDLVIDDELLDSKEPSVSATVETASVKKAVKHARRKRNAESTKNSSINGAASSGTQMRTDESRIDSTSRLASGSLQHSDYDSKRDEDNSLVNLRLETAVDTCNSSHLESEEHDKELRSTEHFDRNAPKQIDQIGSLEAPESEGLTGDQPKKAETRESAPARSDIWRNLIALANSFVNFWRM